MKTVISIVGAGLSGLAAALTLEEAGFSAVVYEASSSAGGRVKTDLVEGYQLDHGFQVLLDAYPKARDYFNYDDLDLQPLLPGAILYTGKKTLSVGDPSRHFPFLLPTLKSGVASLRDLYLLWTLHREVQNSSAEEIFRGEEMTTADFLAGRGFSKKLIRHFFQPFFTGIFLETELRTSSRMFRFVFKMFGSGYASIPRSGMGALPKQLVSKLKKTTLYYNTPVAEVCEGKITLKDGREIASDLILVATDPRDLLKEQPMGTIDWHSCDNLYFEVGRRTIHKPIIGLVADTDRLINNIFYPTSIATEKKGEKELLSVTVVKDHQLEEKALISKVEAELKWLFKIEGARFLKRYQIRRALPALHTLRGNWDTGIGKRGADLFFAGDHLLYGSSNAALLSGERAAKAMIDRINEKK